MKHLFITLSIFFLSLAAMAQPSPVKKAAKSVLKITTFKSDGSILATGYGAFVSADGTALTAWTPFVGASSAIAFDGQGKKYDVDCICGASDIYNVAKIRVVLPQKSNITPLQIEQGQIAQGQEAWFVTYDVKSPLFTKFSPTTIEPFQTNMPYYIFEQEQPNINETLTGSPFLNAQGQLMGLMKTSTTRTDLYCASARYAMSLQPSALAATDNVLRNTSVRIALPDDFNQAVLAMIMKGQRVDSINYPASIQEFITKFPDKEDGYEYKASYLTSLNDEKGAEEAMQKAIEVSTTKDNAHFYFSKLIYDKETMAPDSVNDIWSLDKSIQECDSAIAINPTPIYNVQRGKIFFSQEKYDNALTEFSNVIKGGFRDAEVYYYSYQCLRNLKEDKAKQLEMLDSAVVIAPKQIIYKSERALLLLKMKKYPEAITACQEMITQAPYYAEGHAFLGLALCLSGSKETGIAELKRAKVMGYPQADNFLSKYGGVTASEQ